MKASPVLFWTLLAAGLTTADIAAATSSCHDFNADTVGSYNQSHTATFVNGAKIETTTSSPAVIEVATNSGFGPNALWLNGATGSVYEMVFSVDFAHSDG